MFYYPNRSQAQKIQNRLRALYENEGGEYHAGDAAWQYVFQRTGVHLKAILEAIAGDRTSV
jgi:hypothetical protein